MYAPLLQRVEREKLDIAVYEIEQTQLDWDRMKTNAALTLDHLDVNFQRMRRRSFSLRIDVCLSSRIFFELLNPMKLLIKLFFLIFNRMSINFVVTLKKTNYPIPDSSFLQN